MNENAGRDSQGTQNRPNVSTGILFLPSLIISSFNTSTLGLLASLFLIDMAATFNSSPGIVGQINTGTFIIGVLISLLMGDWSLRFKHKSLLVIGLLIYTVSAFGCALMSDFNFILILFSLSGAGLAMTVPMLETLVGEYITLEKRGHSIGLIVAGGSLVYFIGAPIMVILASYGDWRYVLPFFVIPISLISLILTIIGVPNESVKQKSPTDEISFYRSFKRILTDKSALSCLIGNALRSAQFAAILLYGTSFLRVLFKMSAEFGSIFILLTALGYTIGSIVSGSLVNRFGRKQITVVTALLAGIFTFLSAYSNNLWVFIVLEFLGSWFSGMVATSAASLTLEQIPLYRGSMMSLKSAAVNMGSAFGGALGGLAILSIGYGGSTSILGFMGILSAAVFYFYVFDPIKK